jgi:hypothetical protein
MQQYRGDILQSDEAILRALGDQLAKLAARSTALEKSERILESLYCEEVHRRELGVSEAENRTFFWAFDSWCLGHKFSCGCSCLERSPVKSNGKCWPHDKAIEPPCADHESCQKYFFNWLERDTDEPFMMTGKPGSGNSTFMKFITGHEQTRSALDTWSDGRKLVVASFYFWSSGSPLQRSQDGLLRCLLYKILSQMPDMISVAVPQRWQVADRPRVVQPWSRKEILDAFANVINANSLSTAFCFFIDGLDEYGGSDLGSGETDLDLVLQLKTLSSSPYVKLCLSSRPRNVFQSHFPNNGPYHITLHDHTMKDIEQLVESRIDRVQGLVNIESAELEELKHMIVERSSGVFLWVVLVVRELLNGLEPPFSVPEMRARLLMLPTTLDGYFQKILNNVHQQYRRFNARLLLLSVCHARLPLCYAYLLWLLEHNDVDLRFDAANTTRRQRLLLDTKTWRTAMKSRIIKICGDFLSMDDHWNCIDHNHRSVGNFLEIPAVREGLFANAEWHTESEPHLLLCQLFVPCCEVELITIHDNYEYRQFFEHLLGFERRSGTTCTDLIHELDRILCLRIRSEYRQHWTDEIMHTCHDEWAICNAQALLLFMTLYGVNTFVEKVIEPLSADAQIVILNDLLRAVLLGCYHVDFHDLRSSKMCMPNAVKFLCSKGASVNSVPKHISRSGRYDLDSDSESYKTELGLYVANSTNGLDDRTLWELYLQLRKPGSWHKYSDRARFVMLAVILIEAGADLECRLPEDCDNIQQAIVKRLAADMKKRSYSDGKARLVARVDLSKDEDMRPIRAALAKRGVTG